MGSTFSIVRINGIVDFGGRLHPVLVHLPIGILMLVCLYFIFVGEDKRQSQKHFISVALLFGMLTAVAACISGLILANSGDYEAGAVNTHQWMGILVAVVAALCFYAFKRQFRFLKWGMLTLVVLITITGHLGGAITHGDEYLFQPFSASAGEGKHIIKPIPDIQNAFVYNDIIKPILSSKCYSCHGSSKQKGKLRLDEPDFILKGGKDDGSGVVWQHADKSSLIQRIMLPVSDEDHMPPKEKPQLTKSEMDLLKWWVESGAGFDKKVNQVKPTTQIQPILASLQSGNMDDGKPERLLPEKEVKTADEDAIQKLKEKNIAILPVAANTNYLLANFVSKDKVTEDDLELLDPVKGQLLWLKIGNKNITDKELYQIGKLKNITRLHIDGNPITDAGLESLKALDNLEYINLSGTKVTQKGIEQLRNLKQLKHIFLYKVEGGLFNLVVLKKVMPYTNIDTGGYVVPTFESDTTIVIKDVIK